jgi:ribosomal protein S8
MREDIRQVIERLSQAKVDKLTQDVEQDVIAALEEMLKALKKALKDLEKQRQQPPNSMPMDPQDQPLVDVLSEIKLIRSLQVWVNNRTERYTKQIKGEQADSLDLIEAIQRLAERQERIYRITRDLSAGKNR